MTVFDPNSEIDIHQFSMSEASIELKRWDYSNSDHSIQSLKSIASLESQCEDDTLEFIRRYIDILFDNSAQLTLELKSEFGLKVRTEIGRLLFARLVSAQRSRSKKVSENTFYSLVQHFAIVLFECNEMDDFSPAKILMNMCFTFFYEGNFFRISMQWLEQIIAYPTRMKNLFFYIKNGIKKVK